MRLRLIVVGRPLRFVSVLFRSPSLFSGSPRPPLFRPAFPAAYLSRFRASIIIGIDLPARPAVSPTQIFEKFSCSACPTAPHTVYSNRSELELPSPGPKQKNICITPPLPPPLHLTPLLPQLSQIPISLPPHRLPRFTLLHTLRPVPSSLIPCLGLSI